MNHTVTLHLPQTTAPRQPGAPPSKRLSMLALVAWTLAGTGCYRATGLERTPMSAEVLPETGGDRVSGLKSKGGAGDLYIGNDFIQVAIDSAKYGDPARTPAAGADSGGSIIDAGYILLDTSYTRVSMPGTVMNRLTPVVNQDPRLPMWFDQYQTLNTGSLSTIVMTGGLLDKGNLLGAARDAGGRVTGVTVTHSLSVAQLDRFFTVTTIVTNNTGATLPIRNIGDALAQQGGGYAFNIPANFDYQGNALAVRWGVQIPQYTDFATPLTTSVQAAMAGLMDTEPGADTLDSHCSIGFLPVDADRLLVASDPQDLLTVSKTLRPAFPARLVVGGLPAAAGLADGASLTYNRRLYIVGGQSVATNIVAGLTISANYPNQATGLFNLMDSARYGDTLLRPIQDFGTLTFTLSGMSQRQGPLPTEIRIERNVGAVTPPVEGAPENWQVQRVEWFEPNENIVAQATLATSTLQARLPVGIYRMVLTDQNHTQTRTLFQNQNVVANPAGDGQTGLVGPIWIQKDQEYVVSAQDILSPDAANDGNDPNAVGLIPNNSYSLHYFQTREANGPDGSLQPLRITFAGKGLTADPLMRRMRTLGSYFDPISKAPQVAAGAIPGQYQFRGGNEMFGTGFARYNATQFAWFANGGSYTAYGTRGPLSALQSLDLDAFDGQTAISHTFDVPPMGLPAGWTSFDVPGPGLATTGGTLPSEKLASGMANGVQVVGHTEQDVQVDAPTLYKNFRAEYSSTSLSGFMLPASLSDITRTLGPNPYGVDPFVVGGRTSELANYGSVTALFTPAATNAPLGGALPSRTWTLADFLTQAQGQFNVVHRPWGPQGLFTAQGAPQPAVPGNWWNGNGGGFLSFGKTSGSFEALELLRGESLAGSTAADWFAEFLKVRQTWFDLLNVQTSDTFTKALGLSSSRFSVDTPVGLARTYLKASPITEDDLTGVLSALRKGQAVASTGPFLDVSIGTAVPGGLVNGPLESVTLVVNLYRTDWMPVNEVRVIVNGTLKRTVAANTLTQSGADPRLYTTSFTLAHSELQTVSGKDAWIVVEAGVPLNSDATLPYVPTADPNVAWTRIMRGIYPVAVTNPIFVNVTGGAYKPPML